MLFVVALHRESREVDTVHAGAMLCMIYDTPAGVKKRHGVAKRLGSG